MLIIIFYYLIFPFQRANIHENFNIDKFFALLYQTISKQTHLTIFSDLFWVVRLNSNYLYTS